MSFILRVQQKRGRGREGGGGVGYAPDIVLLFKSLLFFEYLLFFTNVIL